MLIKKLAKEILNDILCGASSSVDRNPERFPLDLIAIEKRLEEFKFVIEKGSFKTSELYSRLQCEGIYDVHSFDRYLEEMEEGAADRAVSDLELEERKNISSALSLSDVLNGKLS